MTENVLVRSVEMESSVEETLLRDVLADRDVPCPVCGYNLRGLTGVACPECGERLVAWVKPGSHRLGWWLTALIGVALCAGSHGLMLFAYVYSLILNDYTTHADMFREAGFVIAFFALGVLVLTLLVLRRQSFVRQKRMVRASISLGLVAISFASIVGFFVYVW